MKRRYRNLSEKTAGKSKETAEKVKEEAEEKSGRKTTGEPEEKAEGEVKTKTVEVKSRTIEELLLNGDYDRYRIIPLAARWAQELKNKEEYKFLSFPQLLNTAVEEIVTGKVTIETVSKLPSLDSRKKVVRSQEKQAERPVPAKKLEEKHEKTKPRKKEK